jgi:signal peptidase
MSAGVLPNRQGNAPVLLTAAGLLAQFLARTTLGIIGAMLFWSMAPNVAGWSSEVVVSNSMMPRIAAGDVVVAAPVDPKTLIPGQVILVTNPARPGTLLMHRLIAWNPDGTLQTQGDANQNADSTPVPQSMVRGLPRLRIPYIGLPMLWFRHGEYRMVVVTGILLMAAVALSTGRANESEGDDPGTEPDDTAPDTDVSSESADSAHLAVRTPMLETA